MFYLLIFGGIIWFYQNNLSLQAQVNIGIHNAQVLTQNLYHQLTGKQIQQDKQNVDLPQDNTNQPTDARWQQKTATIYVALDNRVLKSATETAINQWNATNAFTFKRTNNKKDAAIVVTAVNKENNGAAGLTNTSMNAATGYYLHATVQLNAYYLLNPIFGYSQQRIINTAEHELGHAIGLQHVEQPSVMQPAGSYYSIQPVDVQHVRSLYAKTPQPAQTEDEQSATNN